MRFFIKTVFTKKTMAKNIIVRLVQAIDANRHETTLHKFSCLDTALRVEEYFKLNKEIWNIIKTDVLELTNKEMKDYQNYKIIDNTIKEGTMDRETEDYVPSARDIIEGE